MTNQPKAKWERDESEENGWRADVGPYTLSARVLYAGGLWEVFEEDQGNDYPTHDPNVYEWSAWKTDGTVSGPCDVIELMLAAESALAAHLRAVADTMTWPEAEASDPEFFAREYAGTFTDLRDWVNAEGSLTSMPGMREWLGPKREALNREMGIPPEGLPIGKVDSVTADGKVWVKFGDQWPQGQPVEFTWPPNTWSANAKLTIPKYMGEAEHALASAILGKDFADRLVAIAPKIDTRHDAAKHAGAEHIKANFEKILGPSLIEMWHAGDEGVKLAIDGQSVQLSASHNPLCNGLCDRVACNAFWWQAGYHGHQAQAATTDGYQMLIDRSSGAYIVTRGQSEVAKGSNAAWINDGCELAREAVAAYERAKTRAIGICESRRMAATFLKS